MGKFDTRKIDRIETPPPYRVEGALETHDERKGKQQQQEEDEYSASGGVRGWQKFHTDAKNRRALKVRRRDILKVFLNHVFLQRGLVIIDVNLVLVNRQMMRNAYIFSTRMETYWRLKKLKSGSEIKADEIIAEEYAEISVLHEGYVVKTEKAPEEKQEPAVEKERPLMQKIGDLFRKR